MPHVIRPLLAAKADTFDDLRNLRFPVLASPKLDGIRCLSTVDGETVTRKFKLLPNHATRESLNRIFSRYPELTFDGELMLPEKTKYGAIQSAFMTHDGRPDFVYHIFDMVSADTMNAPFHERHSALTAKIQELLWADDPQSSARIRVVPHRLIESFEDIEPVARAYVAEGYEGIMLRSCDGRYKCGRSTLNEGILIKWKPLFDAEGIIIGFKAELENTNPIERDAFGLAKRSKKKAGMVARETVGTIVCKGVPGAEFDGIEFGVGSGMDDAYRLELWQQREALIGKMLTFTYQEIDSHGAPRFPIFKGLRPEME